MKRTHRTTQKTLGTTFTEVIVSMALLFICFLPLLSTTTSLYNVGKVIDSAKEREILETTCKLWASKTHNELDSYLGEHTLTSDNIKLKVEKNLTDNGEIAIYAISCAKGFADANENDQKKVTMHVSFKTK